MILMGIDKKLPIVVFDGAVHRLLGVVMESKIAFSGHLQKEK